jgi:polysaccharide biosynthesis/export protein
MIRIMIVSCIVSLMMLSGCAARRDLVYFSNMAETATVNKSQDQQVLIKRGDVVNVTVNSLSPESNNLFYGNKNMGTNPRPGSEGYKVDKNGNIQLPLIGEIKIEGLSVEDAQTAIASELIKHVKAPVVDLRLSNFKITVIGEVNKPATFIINDEQVNVLEALGLAGDMTVYGRRENVLIIRNEDGNKTMTRLNLNKLESMKSPFFTLKQNDIVYIEPDRSKAVEYSQNTRMMPLVIASISAIAVLAAVLLKR